MIVAKSKQTDSTKLKTYVYHLNFQCLAGDIEEADECFQEHCQLTYAGKKPGWMCASISREIISAPVDGYRTLHEERADAEQSQG